jgi:hypothetical protein
MANLSVESKLYTGCAGLVYNTHSIRWFTKQFEKFQRWRIGLPKNTPIPTHNFSILLKDGKLYAAEAVFNEFRICPIEQYYPTSMWNELEFYEPATPFSADEQLAFEAAIDKINNNTKGYDVLGYLSQVFHILFNINLKWGKGEKRVYCNEAHEYAYNAARPNSFPHPWNDNPLELQQSALLKKII